MIRPRTLRSPGALLCIVSLAGLASLRAQDDVLQQALAAKARGQEDRAATAFLTLAEQRAQLADPTPSDRIAAEAAAAVAMSLSNRRFLPGLPERVAALRQSPMGKRYPDSSDQFGIAALDHACFHGRGHTLAADLGCLDSLWICGPFENERGAAYARTLPCEQTVDLDANYPGKLRQVAWRQLAHAAPNGRFALGSVLRPAAQVACSVATALRAERDQDIALHLGSAGSFRVRVNGSEVGKREVDRVCAFDQEVVVLPLQKGMNLLQIKLCHQETGDFETTLRLRELDGAPLRCVEVRNEPADLRAAAAVKVARSIRGDVVAMQGARSLLQPGAAKGYDALWLGTLHFLRGSDGNVDRRDHALAQQAAQDLPQLAQARLLLAATRIRVAKVSAELDENARRADYEAILAQDPKHVEAALELARLLLAGTGLRTRAEQLLEQALAANPDCSPAKLLLADVLQARKQPGLARALRLEAAQRPDAALQTIRAGINACGEDLANLQEQLWQRIEGMSRNPEATAQRIVQQLRQGKQEHAYELLADLLREQPLMRLRLVRSDQAEAAGRFADMAKELGQWLSLCPDDDEALAAQARAYGMLGERDRQLEALRAAIECNPNRRDDQRYLEFLASDATPFFAEWQRDAADLTKVATPEAATSGNDATFTLLNQRVLRAHKNGTTSDYRHIAVRILTEAGARAFANFRLPYYGGEQNARLLACTVRKANGKTEQPKLRGASVALPSLQPGDVVDIEGRIDDLAPNFFGDYFGLEHRFPAWDGGATHQSELVVIAEAGREYRFQAINGAPEPKTRTLPDGAQVYAWTLADLPRDQLETNRPDGKERQPLVRFTTYKDWEQFAVWYWGLIKNQLEVTEPMRAKVRELTDGLATKTDRIAALYRFVTTDVRYEAWEFGVHGYKPYSTAVIFERRHGDCKDKALLLCALLGEVGVEARPVLIFADDRRSRDDLTLPLIQHFNHCIAYLPEQDGVPAQFLDGTATWHPPATTPTMDQGAQVVVIGKGKADVRQVPWVIPTNNGDALDLAIALDGNTGGAKVDYRNAPRGNAAVPLRIALGTEVARRKENVERMVLPLFGEATVQTIDANDPMRLDQPVELRVAIDVPRLGQRTSDEWQLPSKFGEDPILSLDSEPQRHHPLLLGIPTEDRQVLRYQLPPGLQPTELPPAAEQQSPFGSFSVRWRRDGQQLIVERIVTIAKERVEPADYSAFRDFVAALRTADSRRIVLRSTEARR